MMTGLDNCPETCSSAGFALRLEHVGIEFAESGTEQHMKKGDIA